MCLKLHQQHTCAHLYFLSIIGVLGTILTNALQITTRQYNSRFCDFLSLRKCAPGECLQLLLDFRSNLYDDRNRALSTFARSILLTSLRKCGLQNVAVANGLCSESCSRSRFPTATTYKRRTNDKIIQTCSCARMPSN